MTKKLLCKFCGFISERHCEVCKLDLCKRCFYSDRHRDAYYTALQITNPFITSRGNGN